MKTRCRLLGHSLDENYNDSGFLVCKRCGMHEYYDSVHNKEQFGVKDLYFEDDALLSRPLYYIKHKLLSIRDYIKQRIQSYRDRNSELPF